MMFRSTSVKHAQRSTGVVAVILAAVFGLIAPASHAQDGPARRLQNIEVHSLPGNRIELRLEMNQAAPEPLSFTIDDPARIALDLLDTGLDLDSRRQEVNVGGLQTVLAAEAQGRTRIVLNLDKLMAYDTRVVGNSIFITLGGIQADEGSRTPFGPAAAAPSGPTSAPAAIRGRAIKDVDFRRGPDGAGRVIVTLSDPRTVVDLREEGGRVVVDFVDTQLPNNLHRRMDVMDFATPVSTVDTIRVGSNVRMVIAASEDYEQIAYQSDEIFTIELQPRIAVAAMENLPPFHQAKEYKGERLTLNFQDIETRAVLQLLADTSSMNIVVSDSVQGNVTLRLQNVPWDQALDIVLRTKGLDMRQHDNVIIVAPAEEIAAREQAELQALRDLQELAPLRSEFLQVNYAKATSLASLIEASGQNSMLSDRGTVAVDERTNTLLLQDTSERLVDIRRLVARLDIPVKQVLIESRIVVVNDDFSRELGIRMGITAVTDNSSNGIISVTGSADGSDVIVGSALDNLINTGQPFPVQVPPINDRFAVNAPISDPVGRLALAILDDDYLVDLELMAAQSEGRGEIISTPRVITANQKEALIEQGVEIPFQESSSSGATTTQFKKAVLSLRVTPQITPDNRVIMDLVVNQDSVGEIVPSATGGFVPSIDTREVITQVLVNDGETVVLGGIYETETRETFQKVPVLGDIPYLGALFRNSERVSNKSELLIFITPKILREGSSLY